jgi:signal peptidase
MTRLLRWTALAAVWAAIGVGVGVALAVAGPYVLGGRSFTVMSGSMEPAIHTGDVVVDETIAPRDARIGDVVTFPDPHRGGKLVTHRLRSLRRAGASMSAVTKGDANNTVERWRVPANGTIGRVVYRVPQLGYAMSYVRTPYGRIVLIGIAIAVIAAIALARIWRREPTAEGNS